MFVISPPVKTIALFAHLVPLIYNIFVYYSWPLLRYIRYLSHFRQLDDFFILVKVTYIWHLIHMLYASSRHQPSNYLTILENYK